MLFLHEVHEVVGTKEDEFEAAFRDAGGWMDLLAQSGDEARLVLYANQAHGGGPSYRVVTLTAIRDGASWERLARRIQSGDLRDWAARLDLLRHDVTGELMLTTGWSPLIDLDLASVATAGVEHPPTLYMEDTMWPYPGRLAEYLQAAGTHYSGLLKRPEALLDIVVALESATGAGTRPEVRLVQRVRDSKRIVDLLATPIPAERRVPGTWMHDALTLRDQWRSRLLRTSTWSPW
jgi:hypothetical protein